MSIMIVSTTTQRPGPEVTFDCPRCGAKGTAGSSFESVEKNTLFWVIPFLTTRSRGITCARCEKVSATYLTLAELEEASPEEISLDVRTKVEFMAKFCVIMGLLPIPFLSLVFAAIALAVTWKHPTGWRTASRIGIVLAVVWTLATVIGICMSGG